MRTAARGNMRSMIRRWQVQPDMVMDTAEGQVAFISREAQVGGVLDAVALCDRAGGGFTVITGRAPTGLPGEMVTTGMVVTWQDRTDAKEQPERAADLVAPAVPIAPEPEVATPIEPSDAREVLEARELAPVGAPVGDGLDNPEDEEDLSSIPAEQR